MKIIFLVLSLFLPSSVLSADCNNNNIDDSQDIAIRDFNILNTAVVEMINISEQNLTAFSFVDINMDGRSGILLSGNQFQNSETKPHLIAAVQGGKSYFYITYKPDQFTYPPQVSIPFTPDTLAVADFNTNEFNDIIFANSNTGQLGTLFNQGNDRFVPANQTFPYSEMPTTAFPERTDKTEFATDINGNGKTDLVIVNEGKVELYLRDNNDQLVLNRTIEHTHTQCTSSFFSPQYRIAPPTDLNGDGVKDLVILSNISCPSASVGTIRQSVTTILLSNGEGSFVEKSHLESGNISFLEFRDVASNGLMDPVFSYSSSTGCVGSPSFCQSPPTKSGIYILILEPVRTSSDYNNNKIPDECERAVPNDFDGDRRSDLAAIRNTNGLLNWILRNSSGSEFTPEVIPFGLPEFDVPFAGDFDGNGKVEPAVVRDAGSVIPSLFGLWWYHYQKDGSALAFQYGLSGDQPVTGYFDSDNISDRAVVRNQNGQLVWYINSSEGNSIDPVPWGLAGDHVFSANMTATRDISTNTYIGDPRHELIVARKFLGQIFWFIRTLDGSFVATVPWGLQNDIPVPPADFDGDGRADLAVARRQGNLMQFYIRLATGETRIVNFGLANDIPHFSYAGGESSAEPAVLRPATKGVQNAQTAHYQRTQTGANRFANWGFDGDWYLRGDGQGIKP
jgi:hypothetical protein